MPQVSGVEDVGALQLGRFQKSVAGSANVTLTQAEYENHSIEFTGALTGSISVFLPLTDGRRWSFLNSTTGNFTLTVIGATGTGVVLLRLTRTEVYTDGTNVYRETSSVTTDGVPAAQVANANVSPGLAYIHRIDVAAGTTGNVDTVLTYKCRVLDVWLVKQSAAGGGAGTIQVFNGTGGNAITDAISININDQAIARAATIDDAFFEVAAGATLRITRTRTASSDETCVVYLLVALVA